MIRRFVTLTAVVVLLSSSAHPSFADHHGGGHGGGWHAGGGTVNAGGWHGGARNWNGGGWPHGAGAVWHSAGGGRHDGGGNWNGGWHGGGWQHHDHHGGGWGVGPAIGLGVGLGLLGERSQRLPITAAMTIATITPLMPVPLDRRFGIGAIPIRATTLRYPNARFPGEKLFSNGLENLAAVLRPFGDVGRGSTGVLQYRELA